MKILFVTPGCFDKGGISRYNRYQVRALQSIYGESSVKVISFLGPDDNSFEEKITTEWHGSRLSFLNKLLFIFIITKYSILWRPDVIHTAHVNFSGVSKFLSLLSGSKTVLNIYGREVWSGLSVDAQWGLKNTDYVISDCHATADYVETNAELRAKNSTEVIWDCVDLKKFSHGMPDANVLVKYGLPDRSKTGVIMTLGRLGHEVIYKGYLRLLEAFNKAGTKNKNLMLVFAGSGDLVPVLKKKSEAMGIQDKIIFTGPIHDDDLADCYRSASVFSLISEMGPGKGEGIPLTPLEAMACGTPILVGNQDGSREAVEQGINGFVLDPADSEEFVEHILNICSDEILREKLSDGALKLARKRFSYNEFEEKHRQFYSKLTS